MNPINTPSTPNLPNSSPVPMSLSDDKIEKIKKRAFYNSLRSNDKSSAEKLLQQDKSLVKVTFGKKATPLHVAACKGDEEMIKLLIENGADLSKVDKNLNTPFHAALNKRNIPAIKCFLEMDSDLVNSLDSQGQTPLVSAIRTGSVDVVKLLLSKNAPLKDSVGYELINGNLYDAIKTSQPLRWKEITQIIKEHLLATEANPKLISDAKKFSLSKQITNAFSLDQFFIYNDRKVSGSGGKIRGFARRMAKSTLIFSDQYPTLLSKADGLELSRLLELKYISSNSIKQQLAQENTLLLRGGFGSETEVSHVVVFLIAGQGAERTVTICNRGAGAVKPLEVLKTKESDLTEGLLDALTFSLTQGEYENSIDQLRSIAWQTPLEKQIEFRSALPFQSMGNCSWANLEGAACAYFFMKTLKNHPDLDLEHQLIPTLRSVEKIARFGFKNWALYQRVVILEKALSEASLDQNLIKSAMIQLLSLRYNTPDDQMDPAISQKIDKVRDIYLKGFSRYQQTEFMSSLVSTEELFNRSRRSPLTDAVYNGYIEQVEELLATGEEINEPDRNGMTALVIAKNKNNLPMIDFLLSNGAL